MADEPLMTIRVFKAGDSFRAELQAPSEVNGVADLRLRGIGKSAAAAIETCITELEASAADGNEIALRFA